MPIAASERGASENGSRLYRSLTHLISGASRIRCKAIVDACDEHEGRVLDLLPEMDGIVYLLKHSQFDFMSNATKQSVKDCTVLPQLRHPAYCVLSDEAGA